MSVRPPVLNENPPDMAARARSIHEQTMSAPLLRLWRAALGHSREPDTDFRLVLPRMEVKSPIQAAPVAEAAPPAKPDKLGDAAGATSSLNLGVNRGHAAAIESAAGRTGIPAAALAAIVDAEAARNKDGAWNPASRNPRSSAAGLTQFLSSSWISEAERAGTYLNRLARGNQWLNSAGQVRIEARRSLLSLRLDATTAIEAAADYAKHNLALLERAGIKVGSNAGRLARLAYLAHHLGSGDAVRFLSGGLNAARAATLLAAQVGEKAALRQVQAVGDAVAAHRGWLERFVSDKISIDKFMR